MVLSHADTDKLSLRVWAVQYIWRKRPSSYSFFHYSESKFSFFNVSSSQAHETVPPWHLNSQGKSKPYPTHLLTYLQ